MICGFLRICVFLKHQFLSLPFPDTWVVIDKSPGHNFGIVFVHGTLEFEYKPVGDLVFACTHLVIYGNVFVGWPEEPMINNVIIQLLGDRYTPDLVVEDGPNIGAKTIGKIKLYVPLVHSWPVNSCQDYTKRSKYMYC